MYPQKRFKWRVALGTGVLVTLGALPQVRAELVYEPEVSPNAPAQVRADDREATREALDASERAKNTVLISHSAPAAMSPATVMVPATAAPVVVAPAQPVALPVAVQVQPQVQVAMPSQEAPQTSVESLSKTELMRRERTREELKNEDILQERLEELRLRDEKRRTGQLLGDPSAASADPNAGVTPIPGMNASAMAGQPQSQVVVSPVTDRPGQPAPEVAPVPTAAQAQQYSTGKSPYTTAAQDQITVAQAAAMSTAAGSSVIPAPSDDKNQFSIALRGGIASMNVNSSLTGVNVTGLGAFSIAGGMSISDNLAFEVGYTYAQYGISLGNYYQLPGQPYSYNLTQNTIDANLKLYFLGAESKLRPFFVGGGGYAMASLGYPSQMTTYYPQLNNQSYSSNAFLGDIGVGLDIRVSKTISIGALFKYYDVLSSNTANNNLYYYNGLGGANIQQALTGASLSESSYYSVQGGVSFSL